MLNYFAKNAWPNLFLSYFLGAFLFFTLPPFNIGFFAPVSFSGFLLLLLKAPSKKRAFFMGALFGMGYFMTGLYWINNALLLDSTFYWLLLPTILLLPAYLSIYIAFPALLTWIVRSSPPYFICFTWAASISVGEYFRGILFSGFPWNPFGLIFSDSLAFLQLASIFGIYGLSFFLVLFSSSLSLLFSSFQHLKFFTLLATTFLCLWGYGQYRLSKNPIQLTSVPITLVQPNIPQHPFFSSKQKRENLLKIINLTKKINIEKPNIIIWPESAVPFVYNNSPSLQSYLKEILPPKSLLILGTIRIEKKDKKAKLFNTLYAISARNGVEAFYDKRHLLPFGEYVPFSDLLENILPITAMTGGGMSFSPGSIQKEFILPFSLPSFLPTICYEAIFPNFQENKNLNPKWIVTITNDAWFGNSTGPYQHFQMSRLRAIEKGLPMIRVATTGISGVVDSCGRILKSSTLNESCLISTYLPDSTKNSTFFSLYGNWSLFFLLISIWGLLFIIKYTKKKYF